MSGACPVVRIVWPANAEYGGFVEINESDFDPEIHTLFEEGSTADSNGDGKVSIGELRDALTARGIEFDPKAKKAALQALLDGANS